MSDGELPLVPLGDVAKPIARPVNVLPGQSYRTLGVKWWGEGAYERETIDGSKTAASQLYEVHEGDLIINKIWVRHGSIGIVPASMRGCVGSGEFPTFRLDPDRVSPRWIHWYSKTREMWGKCDALSQGTSGKNRIKPEKFLTVTVPLPPLPDQRRIVAKIEQLASRIEEARGLRATSQTEAVVLMKPARRTVIGEHVSDSWVPLRDLIADIDNGWSPACLKQPASEQEWGVIKLGAVSFGRFDPTENKQLPSTVPPIPEYEIRPGDFLMSRANTIELVGACTIVRQTRPRLLLCDKVFRFAFKGESPIEPAYLDHALKSPALRQQIEAAATGTSSSMKNISKPKILSLRVPIPPVPEQRRIVAYLDGLHAKVDQLKTLQAQTAAELDALLPSILDKAFRGEL